MVSAASSSGASQPGPPLSSSAGPSSMSATPSTSPRIQVKYNGAVAFDFSPNSSDLTLGDLKEFTAAECSIDAEKLSLIFKGKKLQGLAFPPSAPLSSIIGGSASGGKDVLIQAMGSKATGGATELRVLAAKAAAIAQKQNERLNAPEGGGRAGGSEDSAEVERLLADMLPATPAGMVDLRRGLAAGGAGSPIEVDLLSLTTLSTKLDSLENLSDAQRQLRRNVLKLVEKIEAKL